MPGQRRMAEPADPGRHGERGQRHAERRQQPRLARAAQRPDGGNRLQRPAQRIEQPDAMEARRQPVADRLQRQRERRDGIGEDGVDAAFLRVQVGREGRRPAPGVGDQVALRDGMLRGIARGTPIRAGDREQEIRREDRGSQRDPEDEGDGVAERGGAEQAQGSGSGTPIYRIRRRRSPDQRQHHPQRDPEQRRNRQRPEYSARRRCRVAAAWRQPKRPLHGQRCPVLWQENPSHERIMAESGHRRS
jgi:hypothetical protein